MIYTYELTPADFSAAQRLHRRYHLKARLSYGFWFVAMPVLGVLCLGLLVWDINVRHYQFSPLVGGVLAGLACGGLFGLIARPILIRRAYKRSQENIGGRPVELEIRDGELISRIPGKSEGRFQPASLHRFLEDERVALLYVRKTMFLVIPKHALAEGGVDEIRAWASEAKRC